MYVHTHVYHTEIFSYTCTRGEFQAKAVFINVLVARINFVFKILFYIHVLYLFAKLCLTKEDTLMKIFTIWVLLVVELRQGSTHNCTSCN